MSEQVQAILDSLKIKSTYHHWEKPPKMPYAVYFDDYTDNFEADDIAYSEVSHTVIELYSRQRDRKLEKRLEQLLDGAGLYWDRAVTYIDSERFYQTSYEMYEIEV